MRVYRIIVTSFPIMLGVATASGTPLGTAFTYQGKLAQGGVPANGTYELRFALFDAAADGNPVGSALTNTLPVNDGLFTTALDFGAGVFTGEGRWLEIGVRTNGAAAGFTSLTPRQPLTPSPHAVYALLAGAAGTAVSAATVAANAVSSNSLQTNAVTSDKIADGTIAAADLSPALASNTFWRLSGNAGTAPAAAFLGTIDNQPMEFRVNNDPFLWVGPTTNTPNLVGGSFANNVLADADGSAIAGGGEADEPNIVGGSFNFIGAGRLNTIETEGRDSAIVGGRDNQIYTNVWSATIGGGETNYIDTFSDFAVVAGGQNNFISFNAPGAGILAGQNNLIDQDAMFAVIGGGADNWVKTNAAYATIPGGAQAVASSYGQMAYASGMFSDWGDAQSSLYLLRYTTTNAVTRELFLDGAGERMSVPAGGSWMFQAMIVARSSTGNSAGFRAEGGIKNVGGTVTLIGTPMVTQVGSEITGVALPQVQADNVNDALVIRATGLANQRIRWVARVQTTELRF